MAAPNETPKLNYPRPDKNIVGLAAPEKSESFAFHVNSPASPPLSPLPMLRRPPQKVRKPPRMIITSSTSKCRKYWILAVVLFTIVAVALSIPIITFYGPRSLTFHIEQVSMEPMFYDFDTEISSVINITFKVRNPSRGTGLFYVKDNTLVAGYMHNILSTATFPPFYLPPKGEMMVSTTFTGVGVVLPVEDRKKLDEDQKNKSVALKLDMMGTVRFKFGSVTARAVVISYCDLVLESLEDYHSYPPKVISETCRSGAGFMFPTRKL